MGFAAQSIAMTRLPIAFILKPDNTLVYHKIKLIHGRFFMVKGLGVFEIDKEAKPIKMDKAHVYFYDSRLPKPLDYRILKELGDFAKKNSLNKITRRDVMHGVHLRQLLHRGKSESEAIKEIEQASELEQKKIMAEVNSIDQALLDDNLENLKKGQPQVQIDPEEYTSYVIENLIQKKLITVAEAGMLKTQLIKGEITIDGFLDKLVSLKLVEINSPISISAEKWLDSFHQYDPAHVDAFIDRSERIGEKIRKLGSPVVKNMTPFLYIALACIITAIVVGVVMKTDMSNFKLPNIGQLIPGASHKFLLGFMSLVSR